MKNMTPVVFGLCIALFLNGCSKQLSRKDVQLHGSNCNLKVPPEGSATADVHGTTLALFPKTIAADFNGCQTIWAVANQIVLWYTSTLYKQGNPTVFLSRKLQGNEWRETVCYFEGGRLVDRIDLNGGADEKCPEHATLMNN